MILTKRDDKVMFEKRIDSDLLVVFTVNSDNKIVKKPLRKSVEQSIRNCFLQLNGNKINNLYQLALAEFEKPLLDIVMQYTRGNQSKAALVMGMNRGTLRKKLKKYGMD